MYDTISVEYAFKRGGGEGPDWQALFRQGHAHGGTSTKRSRSVCFFPRRCMSSRLDSMMGMSTLMGMITTGTPCKKMSSRATVFL